MQRSKSAGAHSNASSARQTIDARHPSPVLPGGSEAPVVDHASYGLLREHGENGQAQPSRMWSQRPNPLDATLEGTAAKPRDLLKRTVRRHQLRQMVPLADTTIYEMEQRGEFPRRFYLTPRCVVWDVDEVERWIEERRRASSAHLIKRAPPPDVRKRKTRPVRP
jgi:prophage regulatory protein